jgi:hypothetical protein
MGYGEPFTGSRAPCEARGPQETKQKENFLKVQGSRCYYEITSTLTNCRSRLAAQYHRRKQAGGFHSFSVNEPKPLTVHPASLPTQRTNQRKGR